MHSRNPDKDERPWCYVLKDHALSWEYCHLVACGVQSLWGVGRSRVGRSRVGGAGHTPVEVTAVLPVALPTSPPHLASSLWQTIEGWAN